MTTVPRLGEALLASGDISHGALEQALEAQQRAGGKLGEWLMALRSVPPLTLYRLLATREERELADLAQQPPSPTLLKRNELRHYLAQHFVPWKRENGALRIACTHVSDELEGLLSKRYGQPVQLVYATPRDVRVALEQQFGARLVRETQERIRRETPEYSAFYTLTPDQRLGLFMAFALLASLFTLFPNSMLVITLIVINLVYLTTISFKTLLYARGRLRKPPETATLDEASLPIYSVLIPMYHEAGSVPRILASMRALDYPKHKLDVKLVVEADDEATIRAILTAQPEAYCDIIRVPPSQPRTKPKACSYALHFARGEFVTIYDAEDRPEPLQLKKAVAAFRAAGPKVACLQARLNYFNWRESWLSRFFALEYASLFDIMLPALERLGIPIPLGGTSNHMRADVLRSLRDWDPYNVTEDADLGMRLCMQGYRTQVLNSVTLEEAPIHFGAWLKQRSRWIKGYLQTWIVYMRRPRLARQRMGRAGFWGFHLTIGGPCLVFMLSPFLWFFSALWLTGTFNAEVASWLILLSYVSFAAGYVSHVQYARRCIRRWRWPGMTITALLYPFYWACHSLASLKAVWQLIHRPHYWEKTQHTQSRYGPREINAAIRALPAGEHARKAA